MSFGERIKELRMRYNLSQKDFASKLSLTPGNVGAWEKDLKKPSYEILIQIAKEFDVSLDWLCDCNFNKDLRTWADIIKTIAMLDRSKLEYYIVIQEDCAMIQFSKYYESEEILDATRQKVDKLPMLYKRPLRNDLSTEEDRMQAEFDDEIYYPENPIYNFLGAFKKMQELLKDGSIERDLYELWINQQIEKYSMPIMREKR